MKGMCTINTDASYHSQFKVGAFAFWIVSDLGRVTSAGPFKSAVKSSDEAETQCIINAVFTLKKQEWAGITTIIINTDSLNATRILTGDQHGIKRYKLQWGDYLRKQFHQVKLGLKGKIEFRHVKAHTTTNNARSWVNDWCDTQSKKFLWEQINKK